MRWFESIIHPAGQTWPHATHGFPGWTVRDNLWRGRTRPWTKLTQTRVHTPVKAPPIGPDLDTGFRLRPRHQFHVEWGNTQFKNLGQPSYIGLPIPFSRHENQYVQYLIKVKHAIDPYFLLWKWGQNQNFSSVLHSTTTILVMYFLDWMEWTFF